MAEADVRLDLGALSDQLTGLVVAEVTQPAGDSIAMRFTNGAVLLVRPRDDGFAAVLTKPKGAESRRGAGSEPTRRQKEYLEFIKKYMHRFGVAPAEQDIQRHFLVSAPSINQMIRTLERRGFIVRDRDWFGRTVPRSIRVIWDG